VQEKTVNRIDDYKILAKCRLSILNTFKFIKYKFKFLQSEFILIHLDLIECRFTREFWLNNKKLLVSFKEKFLSLKITERKV